MTVRACRADVVMTSGTGYDLEQVTASGVSSHTRCTAFMTSCERFWTNYFPMVWLGRAGPDLVGPFIPTDARQSLFTAASDTSGGEWEQKSASRGLPETWTLANSQFSMWRLRGLRSSSQPSAAPHRCLRIRGEGQVAYMRVADVGGGGGSGVGQVAL